MWHTRLTIKTGLLALLALLIMALALASCGAPIKGPGSIEHAQLRDTLYSVEPRLSGVVVVWMTHDDVGAYCVTDPALKQAAWDLLHEHDGEVLITYSSINTGEPWAGWCNTDQDSEHSNVTNYHVEAIKALKARGAR